MRGARSELTEMGRVREEEVNYAKEDSDGEEKGEEEVNYAKENSEGEEKGEEEVNYAEEDSDGEDEGRGSELCSKGQ